MLVLANRMVEARNGASALLKATCVLGLVLTLCLTSSTVLARHTLTNGVTAEEMLPRSILFSRITEETGLSQVSVNAIAQDAQGYIWFGTQEGLNRYDGSDLQTYDYTFDNPRALSDGWIWSLMVSSQGILWVGTEAGGLNRYNQESDDFTHYRHDPENPNSLSSDNVRVVYEDSDGIIWIGTDGGGLNRFDETTGQFRRFQHNPADYSSLTSDTVLAIHEDRSGRLWIGTKGGGLSYMDRNSGLFTHFRYNPEVPGSLSDDEVRSIYEDREGRIWIGTYQGGLNLFEPTTGEFRHFMHEPGNPSSLSHNRVRSIFQDRAGTLWVGTDNGLNEWRANEQGFAHYAHDPLDTSSITDNRVTQIYQDRGGVLWIGTNKGANSWNYLSDAYTYYQATGSSMTLSNNTVTAIAESRNGDIWVGTYGGGLNRINEMDATVSHYHSAGDSADQDLSRHLLDDRIMAVHVDRNQDVWVGSRSGGLSRIDANTGDIQHFTHEPGRSGTLSSNSVTSILSDLEGNIWIGTYGGGLNRFSANTHLFETFRHQPGNPESLSSDRVVALHRDRAGILWVGTDNSGFNRFNEGSRTFQRFQHDPQNRSSLSRNSAWIIHEGYDGSLWIGTNGGGLNRWKPEDRAAGRVVFSKYRKGSVLLSDTVQSLVEDSAGLLWVGSNRGLVQLDPNNDAVRHFARGSGLRSIEFNHGAGMRSYNGRLLLGSQAGLVAFYPSQIATNRHAPEIVLAAHGRSGPFDDRYRSLSDSDLLELGYGEDMITFEFSGLDYTAPEMNRYRYILEGFDEDWTKPVAFERATYTNLPAGEYTFRVQAANNDGVWNEEGAAIRFRIIPPIWMTPAAYASYFLVICTLVLAWSRAKARELERLVTERTQELAIRNDTLLTLNDQLKESAWTDSLTGLKNRRFLDEFIDAEVALALRQAREMENQQFPGDSPDIAPALSFMMVDLDGFKSINDNYGHHVGDQALLQVRDVLQSCCRTSDTIFRWGGDEFLIISRNTSSRAAEKLAERIRVGLSEYGFRLGGGAIGRLSGSIGFAVYPFSPLNPELATWQQVSAIADQCTYIAKENGKNCWVSVHGTLNTTRDDVEVMSKDIRPVLASGRISMRASKTEILKVAPLQQRENS